MLLADKLIFADIKYNTQFSLNYQLKESFINPVTNDTIFIHYIGPTKPRHDWAGIILYHKPLWRQKCFAMEEYGVAETEQ